MGAYLLAYVQMGNVWDLIRELFNPTVLYATSGGWFMENDLCLSFAGNEFAVLFCSGTAAVCLMAVENEDTTGWKSDGRLDFSFRFFYYNKQNVEKQRKRQYE